MYKTVGRLLAIGALVLAAQVAQAKTYNGLSFDELFDIYDKSGMSFGVSDGYIEILNGPFIGLNGCEDNKDCTDIVFTITFEDIFPTLDQVNSWNQTYKIPEASKNDDGTLLLEMYLVTEGVTDEIILETTRWFWDTIVNDIDFWEKPAKPTS